MTDSKYKSNILFNLIVSLFITRLSFNSKFCLKKMNSSNYSQLARKRVFASLCIHTVLENNWDLVLFMRNRFIEYLLGLRSKMVALLCIFLSYQSTNASEKIPHSNPTIYYRVNQLPTSNISQFTCSDGLRTHSVGE